MTPRRFELHESYKLTQLAQRGTIVVKSAQSYGHDAYFTSATPCCGKTVRINAAVWSGIGAPVACRGCGWKYYAYLANEDGFLPVIDRERKHPHIRCDRVEWESRGYGTKPYHRRGVA